MTKRKRLDARGYRAYLIAHTKKYKSIVISDTAPEKWDEVLRDSNDNPEDGIRLRESKSEAHLSHSMQLRADSEAELQPGNGDSVLEQYRSIAQLNSDKQDTTMLEAESGSDSKRQCPSFCEYWVPVGFSNLQLEKYCEILIENSFLLCSSVKRGVLDALHEVVTTIRMCCDHPYLVDGSLEKYVNAGRQTVDYLTTGIEASGKLVLLDKILQDAKQKQSRVLIVFQSKQSKSHLTVRYILDDFIRRRFGEESYVHIYQEFDQTKRRAALDLFNNKESGKFVILIEKSSCQSNIKLSSMDFVILFNSDWNPISDLKSLQKMSVESKSEYLKVFRLYSTHSVEEKSLVLAKRGDALDSTTYNFSHNLCHMLLLWSASYLFKRLDKFHSCLLSMADTHRLCEHDHVLHDLSKLLFCQEGHVNHSSLISKIPDPVEGYSVMLSLCGEKDASPIDDDMPHYAAWLSLLEGKKPQWKLLPESSPRMRRKVDNFGCNSECKTQNPLTNRKDMHSGCEPPERLLRLEKSSSPVSEQRSGMVTGNPDSGDTIVQSSPWWTHLSIKDVEEICDRMMQKLLVKQVRKVNVFSRTKRERTVRLKLKHPLECQRYRDSGLCHEKLRNLDNIFEHKLKEHNDLHFASIKKVKQWEDMSVTFLMKKKLKEPISLSMPTQSLNSELGSEKSHMVNESVHAPSEVVQQSETQHLKETEKDMIDGSFQNGDSRSPPVNTPTETVVLSIESDGEDDAASIPRVAPPNDVECNNPSLVPENRASCSLASHCEKQSVSNNEIEGNGSTNTEPFNDVSDQLLSVEPLRGVVGDHPSKLISRCSESDGENDIVMVSGEHDANTEPFNDVSDQLLFGKKDEEPLLNISATEVLDGDSNTEGSVGAPSREGSPSPGLPMSSCVLEKIGASSTSGLAFPLEKGVRVTDKEQDHSDLGHHSNILHMGSVSRSARCSGENNRQRDMASSNLSDNEAQNVDYNEEPPAEASNSETEGRDATNLNTTDRQLNVKNLPELPLSALASDSCEEVQLRTGAISGNLSPSDMPVHSANLACNQITQKTAGLAVPNREIPGTSSFSLPNQSPERLVDLGSREFECPMVQTSTIMSSPVPSVLGQDQPYASSCMNILRPVNNYFLGNSSSSPNGSLLIGSNSLLNELARMEKEKEDVSKSHETEMKSLRSACEKDIEETCKKYDLLLQDAENAFLMKKQVFESFKEKVSSHKILADALQVYQTIEPIRDDLPNALHQLSILLHDTSEECTSPNAQHLEQPLQVHQLSDLITVDQARPQVCSVTDDTRNCLVGYPIQAQFPHLRSSLLPMHDMPTPSHGMQNQLNLAPQLQVSTYFYGMQIQPFLAPAQPPRSTPFHGIRNQQILAPPQPQGSRPFLGAQSQQILAPPQSQGSRPFLGTQSQLILAPPQPRGSKPFLGPQSQQIFAPPRSQGSRPFVGTQSQQILAPAHPQGSRPFVGTQSQQILGPRQPQGSRPFVGTQGQQILGPRQPQGSLPGLGQHGYAPGHLVNLDGSLDNPVLLP